MTQICGTVIGIVPQRMPHKLPATRPHRDFYNLFMRARKIVAFLHLKSAISLIIVVGTSDILSV